jgi:hypothetical protein
MMSVQTIKSPFSAWGILDVVLESSLSHCAAKVKEALTVAVLTEIRSAFNILQLFYNI